MYTSFRSIGTPVPETAAPLSGGAEDTAATMPALLNDGAILSIAYDNVHYKNRPETWNMRLVLGMATILGLVGPVASFGLFYLGDGVFHLDHAHLQTLMYLMLSVAGSMTIFLTRTRGPFWSIRPKRILLLAVLGAEAIATLLAVFGILMTPIGWTYALLVWGYALVWFLLTDRIKLLGYRILDPVKDRPARDTGTADTSPPAPHSGGLRATSTGAAGSAPETAFHTDADPDVYHDNDDCPYGTEIKWHGNDRPGRQGRRQCERRSHHPAPARTVPRLPEP